jgi:hypothetical protein
MAISTVVADRGTRAWIVPAAVSTVASAPDRSRTLPWMTDSGMSVTPESATRRRSNRRSNALASPVSSVPPPPAPPRARRVSEPTALSISTMRRCRCGYERPRADAALCIEPSSSIARSISTSRSVMVTSSTARCGLNPVSSVIAGSTGGLG